jgi:hypothetical protein
MENSLNNSILDTRQVNFLKFLDLLLDELANVVEGVVMNRQNFPYNEVNNLTGSTN